MIDKRKIIKVDVYSFNRGLIISSDDFNILHIEDAANQLVSVVIKGNNVREIPKGTQVEVVFYYVNGDRVKYDTTIDVCTQYQVNVTVGNNSTMLEERRRFYKLETDLNASIAMLTRGEEDNVFDEPIYAKIKNINIGGVFLECNRDFRKRDIISISFKILGKEIDLSAEILRVQKYKGNIDGYGCSFLKLRNCEEEIIARYINKVQRETIDIIKNKIQTR